MGSERVERHRPSWPGTRSRTARRGRGGGTRRCRGASHQLVVDVVSRARAQGVLDAEDLCERVVEPELRRRAPRRGGSARPAPARPAGRPLRPLGRRPADWTPSASRRTPWLYRGAGGSGPCVTSSSAGSPTPGVLGQLRGVAVTVRAHDRQGPRRLVQASGDRLECRDRRGRGGRGCSTACKALQRLVGSATLRVRRPESSHV